MKGKIIFTLCFTATNAIGIFAQTPTPTPMGNIVITVGKPNAQQQQPATQNQPAPPVNDLPTIIANADAQTGSYREEFKNLLGQETKTFESFDKNGKSKKQTVVESNFIVYQSSKDESQVAEYRNVVKVGGKSVGDSSKRATDLFENLAKSTSAQSELDDIQKESSRYDKTLDINGFTLFQSPVLAEHIRSSFDFTLLPDETIDGAEVYAISYQQKTKNPYVIFNDDQKRPEKIYIAYEADVPDSITAPNALLRGKIWIDKKTFQIRRESRELTIQPAELAAPLVVNRTELEYQASDLGILTPKRIVFTDYNVKSKNKGKEISAVLDSKATFDYGKFTKSDVEVKSGDVKN